MGTARETLEYVAIGAGMALASGSFTVLAGLYTVTAGLWVVLAVGLAAVLCLGVSLSLAELASMYPSAPGIGTYLRFAVGRRFALTAVFLYLSLLVAIAGVESFVFAQIVRELFPAAPSTLCVIALFVGVIAINLFGVEQPRLAQLATTLVLVLAVLGLASYALGQPGGSTAAPKASSAGLLGATGMAVFLYMGFEWVMPLGRSPKSYRKALPWSLPITLGVLALTYGSFAAALHWLLPVERVTATAVPQIALGQSLFPTAGRYVAIALSLLATFGAFNAGLMGGARMAYGLAREGSLPPALARLDPDSGVPTVAICTLGALCLGAGLMISHLRLHLVAAAVGAGIECLLYGALVHATLRLRVTASAHKRPFRAPVPALLQRLLSIALPLFGLGALLSLPSAPRAPLFTFFVLAIGSAVLARRYAAPSTPASPGAFRQ